MLAQSTGLFPITRYSELNRSDHSHSSVIRGVGATTLALHKIYIYLFDFFFLFRKHYVNTRHLLAFTSFHRSQLLICRLQPRNKCYTAFGFASYNLTPILSVYWQLLYYHSLIIQWKHSQKNDMWTLKVCSKVFWTIQSS